MDERTHFFIKIYLSHFIIERVDVGCVWEVSWRREQTATYWPKVLLTIAVLLSHSGWATQPWVTEGPKSSACCWLSIRHIVPNWLQLQLELELTQVVCGIWLYFCLTSTCFLWAYASATITEFNHVYRSRWYSDIFDQMRLFRCSSAYLHKCISWLTARSRVNILQSQFSWGLFLFVLLKCFDWPILWPSIDLQYVRKPMGLLFKRASLSWLL